MSFKLETCTDGDMDRGFAILSSAFGHEHPYIDACFPDHDQEIGRKRGGERLLAIKQSDPNTTFIKVTDMQTGKMIALAKWNVYKGTVPKEAELEGEFWQGPDQKEYAQYLFREFLVPRREAIKKSAGRLVCKSNAALKVNLLSERPQC